MIIPKNRGMSLAEIVVAATIITTFIAALVGVYNLHLKTIFASSRLVKASFLNTETVEVLKHLRDLSWVENIASLTPNTEYFLAWQNNRFEPTTSNVFIDGLFERKFVVEEVLRDAQSNIVESGGSLDQNIKRIVITTSWQERNATTSKVLTTYIANLLDN